MGFLFWINGKEEDFDCWRKSWLDYLLGHNRQAVSCHGQIAWEMCRLFF